MASVYHNAMVSFLVFSYLLVIVRTSELDEELTLGFTELPLNTSNFQLQTPYNVPVSSRYSFENGVHRLWVYSTDKPFSPKSLGSRSEVRIQVSLLYTHINAIFSSSSLFSFQIGPSSFKSLVLVPQVSFR